MDRDELRSLIAARRISQTSTITDPLGLSLELLRPDSLGRALQALDRGAIAALQALASGDPEAGVSGPGLAASAIEPAVVARLRAVGLVGIDPGTGDRAGDDAGDDDRAVALPEVAEALRAALGESDDAASENAPVSAPDSSGAVDLSSWYAPALASVRRAAALVDALAERPAQLGRRGRATVVSARELAAATRGDAETTSRLLAVVQDAGLAFTAAMPSRRGGEVLLLGSAPGAPAVREWLDLPLHARWVRLAAAAASTVDAPLRGALALSDGDLARAAETVLPLQYPLLPQASLAAAQAFAATAEELGLTVGGRLSPPAQALLDGDGASARALAEEGFPPIATGVYLQPDLSLIVPGPLPPADERSLAEIGEAEQWGVAVTLRLTPASLRRALRHGGSTARIRELLERLSLTGIPQPLDYLLRDLQRTHGAGVAAPAGPPVFGRADSPDSPDAPDAPDEAPFAEDGGSVGSDDLDALAELVYEAARSAPGSGELSRRLELAIRDRTAVRVTAAAAGQERSFTLLPVAITSGRLRATDEQAGVQRTLPLSAIVAVEAA